MGYRLGIDLGTTWTAAAVNDGSHTTMVGLGNRALQIPSVVFVPPTGSVLIGEAAERRAADDPTRAIREFKRRIGDPVPLYVDGLPYSPRLLTSKLLEWVVERVTERAGEPPEAFTLTYPANWGDYRRGLLDEVCELARLDSSAVTYCTEPEAAALQYAARAPARVDGPLLVYDLGGGTFDVCVLAPDNERFRIVGKPAGLDYLGGVDFDALIFQWVLERLGESMNSADPSDPPFIGALNRLRRECVDAKEALSSDVDVQIPVILPGIDVSYRLMRSEFEEMIRPSISEPSMG